MKNERGNLVLALVIGIALMAGSAGLFNYLRASQIALTYVSDRSRIDPAQNYILARLKTCLTLQTPAFCPKSAEFRTMLTLPGTLIDATTVAPVAPILLSKADMESTPNFLTARQSDIDDAFSDFSVKVERQNSVDDPVFGSTRVTMTMTAVPISHSFGLRTRELSKSYRVTIQTPLSFGLMLRFPNNPAIILGAGASGSSTLAVIGGTLFFTNAGLGLNPQAIVAPASSGYVSFDRAVTTSPAIALDDAADRTSYRIFSNGIRVHAFDGVSNPFMTLSPWEQPFDYGYVFGANGYPLPAKEPTAAHANNCDRKVDWNKTTSSVENRSGVTTFPSALVMGSSSLAETCSRPDNFAEGSIKAMVLLRAGADLTFDYTAAGGTNYACGMVLANKITFNIPDGQTSVWYGHISAKQIEITGGGHFVILNPFSAASYSGDLPMPPNLAISELQQLFIALGSSTAHNFYVPFSRTPANLPPAGSLSEAQTFFTGAGPCKTWPLAVDPPDLSGYLSGATWDQDLFFSAEEGL
jgi:hypothetical protein